MAAPLKNVFQQRFGSLLKYKLADRTMMNWRTFADFHILKPCHSMGPQYLMQQNCCVRGLGTCILTTKMGSTPTLCIRKQTVSTTRLISQMPRTIQQGFSNPLFKPVKDCRNLSRHFMQPTGLFIRGIATDPGMHKKNKTSLIYICAIGIFMTGMAYAGVPLYRMFCQATGLGGQAVQGHDSSKVETMTPVKDRLLRIRFNADTASSMQWNFKPQQPEVKVLPGETALAFYTAKNPTDKPIIGISTYNVVPFEAGLYFNKIQCFCFEEQRLNPHEEVDMPVFFYIDPDFAEDPKLENVDTITLSYTFFEAKEGMHLPLPGYMTSFPQPQGQGS